MISISDVSFLVQWNLVLVQAWQLVYRGVTLKAALLQYKYPPNIPDKPKDFTKYYEVVDHENGLLIADDGNSYFTTVKLYWQVIMPDGAYFFDSCRVLCPDGTIIFYP